MLEAAVGALPAPGRHHDHGHAATIDGSFVDLPRPLARDRLADALGRARARFGTDLLRLKGIVALDGGRGDYAVQLQPDGTVEFVALPSAGNNPPRHGLTLITRHCPAGDVAAWLATEFAPPAPASTAG